MKRKIVIVRPYVYSGGTLVLDALCQSLRKHGVDARILYVPAIEALHQKGETETWHFKMLMMKDFVMYALYRLFRFYYDNGSSNRCKRWRNRYKATMSGLKRQLLPCILNNKTIVVYPEIIYGNFLHAKHVVRWLLYYNRFKDAPDAFGKDDLIICYRKQFNDWDLNPNGLTVNINYFNSQLYRQYNLGERKGNCFLIKKGQKRKDLPNRFDGPVIDNEIEEEKVRIFNTSKYFYSYDTQTFYCTIAAVCGCIPIVALEEGKTIHDYLTEEEVKNEVGIAWGDSPDEIQHAIDTREQLLHRLDYSQKNEENTIKFIQYVSERFHL